ncbi:hypothetical protein PV10_03500 [Exophiala mesophila]|uniref:Methyltransferase domain-containing protein n=1 Tax=Exophiala mesophila TaxID=212818 RepID=A0A0D1ZPL2_EXOME|nr:uncharacterized protein PV10_03500 [Exophiala mesophila]KIV95899.1 hypothetical protein PV10_03500 [Exophiala mesophila]
MANTSATQTPRTDTTQSPGSAYTQGHSAGVVASHASRTVENSAAFLTPHLQPGYTLVDLGCGPGTITQGFCALVPQGRVIGIDASEEVISQARSRARETTTSSSATLEFQVGDITSRLPFADESVDVVYTHQTLCHIPDPVAVIKEAFRVLKPGGLFASREYDHMTWHPSLPGLVAYTESMDRAIRSSGAQGSQSGRNLQTWASQAGFDRAKMLVGAGTTCHVGSEAQWWAGVNIDRLQTEVGAGWLTKGIVTSQQDIGSMIGDFRRWAADDRAWYVNLHGEIVARK